MSVAPTTDAVIAELRAALGAPGLLTSPEDRSLHGSDASRQAGDCVAVARPATEAEVVAVVTIARRHGLTLVPRGAGTSPTGSASSRREQLVVDLSRMNRIVDVDQRDLVAVVEPGVLTGAFQSHVETFGLFYPPDPASSRFSTLGGNVATAAGGLRAVKYGVTRDYVLGVRAVLADASTLQVGGRALKRSVGYDLTRLFVGSEGTLGIITQLTLRLIPRPRASATILASFDSEVGGFAGADAVLEAGVLPRALEYMDGDVVQIVSGFLGEVPDVRCRSRLLIEVDGSETAVAEETHSAVEALRRAGAYEARHASSAAERDALWKGRRGISPAVYRVSAAKKSEDLGVPRGQLADAIAEIKAAGRDAGIRILAYGHAGDANLHVNFLYDPAKPGDRERLATARQRALAIVMRRGGTISGEHGIGNTKLDAMKSEVGARALELMQGVKRLFDPDGIMNPGKAVPAGRTEETETCESS